MTIVMSHVDYAAFVVIVAGWQDILGIVVHEGILLQMRDMAVGGIKVG